MIAARLRIGRPLGYGEVAACLAAVQASGASLATKLALDFLVLTAARSGEVRLARWSEIDPSRSSVDGAGSAHSEEAVGREHRVPLSGRALAVLELARMLGKVSVWCSRESARAGRSRT